MRIFQGVPGSHTLTGPESTCRDSHCTKTGVQGNPPPTTVELAFKVHHRSAQEPSPIVVSYGHGLDPRSASDSKEFVDLHRWPQNTGIGSKVGRLCQTKGLADPIFFSILGPTELADLTEVTYCSQLDCTFFEREQTPLGIERRARELLGRGWRRD